MMMKESIFDNIWFVRIISLAFALFLYAFVSSENSDQFQAISNQQFASIETSETISNVPVYLGEHDEDVFVSEMPESVTVKLTGPRNIITQVTVEDFIVQTEDIRGIDTGRQTIRLIAIGLPEEIEKNLKELTSMNILGSVQSEKLSKVQILKQLEVMNKSAGNSSMNSMMQAGMGMSMGMQMAGMFNQGVQQMNANAAKVQAAANSGVDLISCPNCHAMIKKGSKFCSECGTKMEVPVPKNKFCPECGAAAEEGMKFCAQCGHKLV